MQNATTFYPPPDFAEYEGEYDGRPVVHPGVVPILPIMPSASDVMPGIDLNLGSTLFRVRIALLYN